MVSSQMEQREVRSQVKCSDTEIDQELVKDVKMLPITPPLETKSPSLDNVFDQGELASQLLLYCENHFPAIIR